MIINTTEFNDYKPRYEAPGDPRVKLAKAQ